ncbi:major capsid protein [Hydrogenophaga laconesensis]|uniref:Bacteriophage coat protein B n=1 Tax=Hydrogenophaga laconesensis TaxID=1805971 RepID=A0ABU1VDJ7_9BURK|nr:major capsid protein [Hydrogenophaga laconesensis]MDR7095517.1 hypothetical protein [Hydrogenophaga laconesensis]
MKPFNAIKRFGAKVPAAVGTGLLLIGTSVHAALPASLATDVASAKEDIGDAGGLAIGILLALLLFVWLRRVMK